MSDAQKLLGLEADATRKEIRKAYPGLARRWHPDGNRRFRVSIGYRVA